MIYFEILRIQSYFNVKKGDIAGDCSLNLQNSSCRWK